MIKKMKKKLRTLMVLLLSVWMTFMLCGFSSLELEATLKHNGKGSAMLTFETDKSQTEFERDLQETLSGYNNISAANTQAGGSDMLVVKSIEKTDKGYCVEIAFRRIDKLAVNGKFEHQKLADYLENYIVGSELDGEEQNAEDIINYQNQTLVKWSKGNLTGITIDAVDRLMTVKDRKDNSLKIEPQTFSGEKVELDSLIADGKKAKSSATILTFFMLGVEDVKSVQMTFPGKVTHYAGNNITIIGEDTVKITPAVKTVQVQGGEEATSLTNEEVGCLVGYIIYEKSMSPTAIALVIGMVLLAASLLVWLYLYFTKKGKQIRAESGTDTDKRPLIVGIRAAARSETWKRIKRHKALYLFVLPAVVFMLVFNYAPMFGVSIAFKDYNVADGVFGSEFIGLSVFKKFLLSYDASYRPFRNTIFIALVRIFTNFPIILIATLFVNELKSKKVKSLVSTISYIPYFISWVAIGGMTHNLFAVDGIFNKLLTNLGMETINWYAEPDLWWPILAFTSLWKGLGWSTLIYISSLGLINTELYEACKIDGGGKIRQALTVTIPGIMNVVLMQLILDVGSIMADNYDQIRALTMGSEALNETVYVVGALEFNNVMGGRYTEGAVYGLIRGVIGLALVLITDRIAKSTDNEGVL